MEETTENRTRKRKGLLLRLILKAQNAGGGSLGEREGTGVRGRKDSKKSTLRTRVTERGMST